MNAPELIVTNSQGTAIVTEQVRHPRDVTYIRSDLLIDPNAVHMNMLRGTLAKPSVDQIVHIYGPEALAASPEVAKLIERAILDAQLRCLERGRIDTPDEVRAEAAALRKGETT